MNKLDLENIKARIYSLVADLDYADDIFKSKSGYETNLWAIQEQKKLENNGAPEMQDALEAREKQLLKQIENCDKMLALTREKMLRALGKL